MKYFILFIMFFVTACATSDITVNRDAMKPVKVVAIAPFSAKISVKKDIFAEAEEKFRTAFINLGYNVSGKEKINDLFKSEGDKLPVNSPENVKRIGKATGADAVLFGEITDYKEETKEMMFFPGFISTNKLSNKSHDELRYITTYTFRVVITLVDTADGSVIMTMKNRVKEIQQEENLQCCDTLDAYSKYTIKKMADELIVKMKEKN